jgi:hypothetical protein
MPRTDHAEIEQLVDGLYELPLSEFVRERNALAARLAKEGKRGPAANVKALRKPTAAAWSLNQAARRHPELVAALLRAGDQLRRRQREAMQGNPRGLRPATDSFRSCAAELTQAAAGIAGQSKQATPQGLGEKVSATLQALPSHEEGRELLRRAQLSDDLVPQGFDSVMDLIAAPPGAQPAAEVRRRPREAGTFDERAAQARHAKELAREAKEATRRASRALREAESAERSARQSRERATSLEREAAQARQRAQEALGESGNR